MFAMVLVPDPASDLFVTIGNIAVACVLAGRQTGGSPRDGGRDFHGRAGGELGNSAVGEGGQLLVCPIQVPCGLGNAGDEIVRIVVRYGSHREDFARINVHHDSRRTTGETQRVFKEVLGTGIDRQSDFGSYAGFGIIRHPDRSSFLVFDDRFLTFRAT